MLLNGTRAAPFVCLRCRGALLLRQLPRAGFHRPFSPTDSNTSKRRHFSGPSRCCQEHVFEPPRPTHQSSSESVTVKKVFYGPDRVDGRRGKVPRRAVSEPLKITSLGEQASVLVLEEAVEPLGSEYSSIPEDGSAAQEHEEQRQGSVLLAPDSFNLGDSVPEQKEVDQSIDSLRPQSQVLEDDEFQALTKQLFQSYNQRQLANYLRSSHGSRQQKSPNVGEVGVLPVRQNATSSESTKGPEVSKWRQGSTHISHRHGDPTIPSEFRNARTPKKMRTPKKRLAEHIIRQIWDISTRSDQQMVGEIEMKMEEWQMKLLFDSTLTDGTPNYERFISSRLLLRSSRIVLHRPAGIVRIIGRRQDAEEVAQRLAIGAMAIKTWDLELKPFSMVELKLGRATPSEHLWSSSELDDISAFTNTLITLPNKQFAQVRGFQFAAVARALRIMAFLLNVTARQYHLVVQNTWELKQMQPLLFPISLSLEQHRWLRQRTVYRLACPTAAEPLDNGRPVSASPGLSDNITEAQNNIMGQIYDWNPKIYTTGEDGLRAPPGASDSSWISCDTELPSRLSLKIGQLLVAESSEQKAVMKPWIPSPPPLPTQVAFHHHTTAAPILLSHFQTRIESADLDTDSNLQIELMPAVHKRSKKIPTFSIPRIILKYRRRPGAPLKLQEVRAVLYERIVSIPLPTHSIDIQLVEQGMLQAQMGALMANKNLQAFTDAIDKAFGSAPVPYAAIPPKIFLPLPSWLVKNTYKDAPRMKDFDLVSKAAWKDAEFPYLVDHMQFSATKRFYPLDGLDQNERNNDMDPQLRILQKEMAGDISSSKQFLSLREVSDGAFKGRSTQLSILSEVAAKDKQTLDGIRTRLVRSGLRVVDAVRRIGAGELKEPLPIRRVMSDGIPPPPEPNNGIFEGSEEQRALYEFFDQLDSL